jgi:L-ascorbate metabolism protein UlaG (beta-lactamase superfamily)
MDIFYLGHSSFRLKGKTASLVTDPFDPEMVGLKYSGVEGDIVTVSHEHHDHSKVDLVKGAKRVIEGPGEYEMMGVSVLGFSSYHDNKKGEERGKNTIYVIEMDGLRLAHLGDLGHELSEELVENLGDIDILFIPVGGVYTIGPVEAVKVVQAVEPSFVIPMHFQTPGLNPETFKGLEPVETFLKEVGLAVERLPKLSIKKEDLGEEQKVVVLEKK